MPNIRIPTPLRPYVGGSNEVSVKGDTVGAALQSLTTQHPDLRKHLYTEAGELRAFVNVFLGQEDVRHMQGEQTPLKDGDQLRIVPSVAGGAGDSLQKVDHLALRVNQAFIIGLTVLAFILYNPWIVAFVALVMAVGTALRGPGFKPVYKLLKDRNLIK
jgi:sulfur-carrier protein